jgi:hypothetical protein
MHLRLKTAPIFQVCCAKSISCAGPTRTYTGWAHQEIDEQLSALENIQRTLQTDEGLESTETDHQKPSRVPIIQGIEDYVRERGRSFTPAEIKQYLKAKHGRASYGSIYQTLTRMEQAGKLRKEGRKFEAVEVK